ncbi:MAG: outer membrane lipoprotein carrier protein LolA [Flavobacteriaceae bacterium]|nr:outer membrane lipoprotein carrier protein LolA [Flavobacteriaceae bacterium]
MKVKLFVIGLLCIANLGFSQQSDRAKKLLDEVNQKITSYKSMYITFKYSLDNNAENIHQTTRGNITVMGDLYNVSYLGGTKIFDGEKIYTILPEDEEINISDQESEEEESLIRPSKFFSFYKIGYTYSWVKLITMKGKKIQNIVLTPTDDDSEVNTIVLGINTKVKEIYRMVENGKNGTLTTLTINKFRKNLPKISKRLLKVNLAKYKAEGYTINEAQ